MIEVKGKNFIAYNMGESVLQSIVKDTFTFLMLCFCLYISHWAGSVFWTFTSGLMFFAFMGIRMGGMLRERHTKLRLGRTLRHGWICRPKMRLMQTLELYCRY